jgi:hypothetical protein
MAQLVQHKAVICHPKSEHYIIYRLSSRKYPLASTTITIARYTVLEALRNRMLPLVLVILGIGLGLAFFLKQVALTETREIQVAFLAATFRLTAVFVVCAFIVTSQVREVTDKVLELLLSRALPRPAYFFGKLAGHLTCALLLAVLLSLPLYFLANPASVAAWSVSLFCELAIVAAASLFCVLTLNHVVASLAAMFGFYLLARSIAVLQLIGGSRATADGTWFAKAANGTLNAMAYVLPRLDSFTDTGWVVYGTSAPLAWILLQSVIYTGLLACAALFDLYRKNI